MGMEIRSLLSQHVHVVIVNCGLAWPAHGLVWFGLERDRLAVPRYPNSVLSRCFAEASLSCDLCAPGLLPGMAALSLRVHYAQQHSGMAHVACLLAA